MTRPGGGGAAAPLEGRWTLCLSEATRGTGPVCGALTAELRRGTRPTQYYQVEHNVALDSVLGTGHALPRFGVIAPADSGAWPGSGPTAVTRGARSAEPSC